MEKEVWLKIPNLNDWYEVSNFGRIRSVDRIIERSDTETKVFYKGKLLTLKANRYGYLQVRTSINDKKFTLRPHRLVAELFVNNPEGKVVVNHINGDKADNLYLNLEWVTYSENSMHAIETGLMTFKVGQEAPRFERAVDVFKDGMYTTTLYGIKHMKEFGVDFRLVSACLKGKRKSHKGYTFKIKED